MSRSVQVGPNPRLIAAASASAADPDYQLLTMDGSNNFNIDLAVGLAYYNFKLILTAATTDGGTPPATIATILPPTRSGGTITPGLSFVIYIGQDSTGSWPPPALDTGTGGFTTNANTRLAGIEGSPNLWTYVQFTWHGSKWGIDVITPGISLT